MIDARAVARSQGAGELDRQLVRLDRVIARRRLDLSVRLRDVGVSEIANTCDSAGRTNVVLEILAGNVGYGDRRIDRALHVDDRIEHGDENRVAIQKLEIVA